MRTHASTGSTRQRGAATLVVVMILFFIISLVAAYTNRNLIFEQRTSSNQYRSTQALEAAEAGLEWAVTMLNFGRIDTSCNKSASNTDGSFRGRYISTDPITGKFTPVLNPAGTEFPTCVSNGSGWDCACPDPSASTPTLTPPAGTAVAPAFRVRLRAASGTAIPPVPKQPGVIWVDVVGCTRLDPVGAANPCLSFAGQGTLNEGRVVVSSMLALGGSASGMPLAALTVRGDVALTGSGAFNGYNTGVGASGLAIHASGTILPTGLTRRGAPGAPEASTQAGGDSGLAPTDAGAFSTLISGYDRSFASIFNMRPESYQEQQAAVFIDCSAGCNASTVYSNAIERNPGRPLWLNGNLNVDSSLGTADKPLLLVVHGEVTFSTAAEINGLVYVRLPRPLGVSTWTTSGTGRINGAVVVDGDVVGTGNTTVVYDSAILQRVRYGSGSFVRVPGSWRDFQ